MSKYYAITSSSLSSDGSVKRRDVDNSGSGFTPSMLARLRMPELQRSQQFVSEAEHVLASVQTINALTNLKNMLKLIVHGSAYGSELRCMNKEFFKQFDPTTNPASGDAATYRMHTDVSVQTAIQLCMILDAGGALPLSLDWWIDRLFFNANEFKEDKSPAHSILFPQSLFQTWMRDATGAFKSHDDYCVWNETNLFDRSQLDAHVGYEIGLSIWKALLESLRQAFDNFGRYARGEHKRGPVYADNWMWANVGVNQVSRNADGVPTIDPRSITSITTLKYMCDMAQSSEWIGRLEGVQNKDQRINLEKFIRTADTYVQNLFDCYDNTTPLDVIYETELRDAMKRMAVRPYDRACTILKTLGYALQSFDLPNDQFNQINDSFTQCSEEFLRDMDLSLSSAESFDTLFKDHQPLVDRNIWSSDLVFKVNSAVLSIQDVHLTKLWTEIREFCKLWKFDGLTEEELSKVDHSKGGYPTCDADDLRPPNTVQTHIAAVSQYLSKIITKLASNNDSYRRHINSPIDSLDIAKPYGEAKSVTDATGDSLYVSKFTNNSNTRVRAEMSRMRMRQDNPNAPPEDQWEAISHLADRYWQMRFNRTAPPFQEDPEDTHDRLESENEVLDQHEDTIVTHLFGLTSAVNDFIPDMDSLLRRITSEINALPAWTPASEVEITRRLATIQTLTISMKHRIQRSCDHDITSQDERSSLLVGAAQNAPGVSILMKICHRLFGEQPDFSPRPEEGSVLQIILAMQETSAAYARLLPILRRSWPVDILNPLYTQYIPPLSTLLTGRTSWIQSSVPVTNQDVRYMKRMARKEGHDNLRDFRAQAIVQSRNFTVGRPERTQMMFKTVPASSMSADRRPRGNVVVPVNVARNGAKPSMPELNSRVQALDLAEYRLGMAAPKLPPPVLDINPGTDERQYLEDILGGMSQLNGLVYWLKAGLLQNSNVSHLPVSSKRFMSPKEVDIQTWRHMIDTSRQHIRNLIFRTEPDLNKGLSDQTTKTVDMMATVASWNSAPPTRWFCKFQLIVALEDIPEYQPNSGQSMADYLSRVWNTSSFRELMAHVNEMRRGSQAIWPHSVAKSPDIRAFADVGLLGDTFEDGYYSMKQDFLARTAITADQLLTTARIDPVPISRGHRDMLYISSHQQYEKIYQQLHPGTKPQGSLFVVDVYYTSPHSVVTREQNLLQSIITNSVHELALQALLDDMKTYETQWNTVWSNIHTGVQDALPDFMAEWGIPSPVRLQPVAAFNRQFGMLHTLTPSAYGNVELVQLASGWKTSLRKWLTAYAVPLCMQTSA